MNLEIRLGIVVKTTGHESETQAYDQQTISGKLTDLGYALDGSLPV